MTTVRTGPNHPWPITWRLTYGDARKINRSRDLRDRFPHQRKITWNLIFWEYCTILFCFRIVLYLKQHLMLRMDCSNFLCCFILCYNCFSLLQKVVSYVNEWYFNNIDSVSITLVFITIITLFCVVYNLLAFFKEKYREDEGTVAMWNVSKF